ncbi:putative ABC transport system permease protein [Kineothrix alysoides]|uniref:Putative ABC transport system permease protein n=1 Tax=Kineothrix alysoides TaxID=1469948 RepID=A0A4R1QVW8_9FIRM|nr:FtsX-like permease family protein [Kineothrix alysoides]TCL57321.1 putative ABC transport system permease protein [Kineothrix alysoides]
MNRSYKKDTWRSMKKNWKRFLSILIITMLGVTMLTGIYAACQDMYYSADKFFDRQNLFDIRIVSTLGLSQEDIDALEKVEGVELAEGGYSKTVNTYVDGISRSGEMTVLSENGMNIPYLLEGKLPMNPGEIAVTQKYIDASGKSVGDTITIEEESLKKDSDKISENSKASDDSSDSANADSISDIDLDMDEDMDMNLEEEEDTPVFAHTTYTITGIVIDPMNIQSEGFGTVYRSAMSADYTFFIIPADADSDIFTVVYLTLSGTIGMDGNSDEYESAVRSVIDDIENRIKEHRERARYYSVISEARGKIEDAEDTMNEKFAEADEQFSDAWSDIDDGKQELADGEDTLSREEADALKKIAEARAELSDGKQKLADSEAELLDGETQLAQGEAQLNANARQIEDGLQELADGRRQAEDKFAEANEQLSSAQNQLDESRTQLEAGLEQIKAPFGAAWPENEWNALVNAAAALAAGGAQDADIVQNTAAESAALSSALQFQTGAITAGLSAQIAQMQESVNGINVYVENLNQRIADAAGQNLDEQTIADLTAERDQKAAEAQQLIAAIGQIQAQAQQLNALPASGVQAAFGMAKINGGQQVLDTQKAAFEQALESTRQHLNGIAAQLAGAEAQIAEGRKTIEEKKAELQDGRDKIESAKAELVDGETTLNTEVADAKKKIADAKEELEEGKQDLAEGETKLLEKEQEYTDKKEEASGKIADAYAELDDIDMTQWYVQDRISLDSYSSLHNDMSSIEAVGNVFPIIFLVVAALMSLTTMTRMVEEERGLVGTYQALGFKNAAVYWKYLLFALLACLFGGILGDLAGFILFPKFLLFILETLYNLPEYYLRFDMLYGIGGVLLFLIGIAIATVLACHSELNQTPATLMRPKAPRAGSRVFLERLPFIWNRFKFLNKVTVRNLFRFKKRLFMTVGGIMGCTALVLCGFALKDTIVNLAPEQYEEIYCYDLMAVVNSEDNDFLMQKLSEDGNTTDYLNLQIDSIKLLNSEKESEKVQLMVIPEGASIENYIHVQSPGGSPVSIDGDGIYVTQNAAQILNLSKGDTVSLQNLELEEKEAVVAGTVKNYLGNNIYMTQSYYETLFEEYTPNGVLVHLSEACTDHEEYARSLKSNDEVLTAASTAGLKEDFGFDLINAVVLLLIVMAGGLAFVVLFTLSNTNISERVRELATIKVLGFYDNEVHQYVHKETLILTFIGILAGLPLGRFLSGLLTSVLQLPSVYFAVHVELTSYLISSAITLCFALAVNLMTNRALNRINMVEALKSME